MIFIVERRVGGQGGFEMLLDFVVVGVVADPAVAGQDAVRVRVDDERRQAAGVEQDRVGRFRADAVDRQQLFAERRRDLVRTSRPASRRTLRRRTSAGSAAAGLSPGSSRPGESARPAPRPAARTARAAPSRPRRADCAIARSTFRQAVFCTSTAPTMISNGESPGHQCCGPNAASSRSYACRAGCDMSYCAQSNRTVARK